MTSTSRPGRPRRSSAEILADAASELFLENGYSGTTVDQIAQRAGVSRATFFNYFAGKADLLWLDLDQSLDRLPGALRDASASEGGRDPRHLVADALVAVAAAHDDQRVPWALSQAEAMRIGDDLTASAALRFVTQQKRVAAFLAERSGEPQDAPGPQIAAATLLAAAGAATVAWARAGIGRGRLVDRVEPAVRAVARGFTPAGPDLG